MKKIILSVSITLLALAVLFAGIAFISPSFVKDITSRIQSVPINDAVIFDNFEGSNNQKSLPNGSSAVILGETTESKVTPTSKPPVQYIYQPPESLPTATPTQAPVIQQQIPWADFANKEAYCKNIAQNTIESPKMLEIANEYYDKLVKSLPAPEPGQDPSTYLTTPTFSQYYAGLKSDVYKGAYDECIKL